MSRNTLTVLTLSQVIKTWQVCLCVDVFVSFSFKLAVSFTLRFFEHRGKASQRDSHFKLPDFKAKMQKTIMCSECSKGSIV